MGDLIDMWDELLLRRLREDAKRLELSEEAVDRIWQRMIAEHPELEDLILEVPEDPPLKGFIRRWLDRLLLR